MSKDKYILKDYFGEENLRLAFERYRRVTEYDSKDFSGIEIFNANLDNNIKSLSQRLLNGVGDKDGQFNPIPPLKFYKPKKTKGSLRTYTLLFVEESIVYQCIVDKIATDNFKKLVEVKNSVFSYRLTEEVSKGISALDDDDAKHYFYERWQDLYPKFVESTKKQLSDNKNQFKLETDISGFYDTIQHSILLNFLKKEFNVPNQIVELLGILLNSFSGTPDVKLYGVGLPQGPMPSHFLAQLMLYNFDLNLIDKGYASYLRFVDDIVIFSKKESDLYRAKSHIEKRLKDISLYMNSKKTDITSLGSKDSRQQEIKTLEARLFAYVSDDSIEENENDLLNKFSNFDVIESQSVFPNYDNVDHSDLENEEVVEDLNSVLKNEIELFEGLINDKDYIKLAENQKSIISKFYLISNLMHSAENLDLLESYMWEDYCLDQWVHLYEYSFDNSILNILDNHYNKTEKLKESLLYLYDKYDYLEYVQYKLTISLSSKEFDFNTNELSEFYRNNIDKISVYARLSFYLFFISHLNVNDPFFTTVMRSFKKDDQQLFYFKDWVIWHLKWRGKSNDELLEIIKLIQYG